MAEIHEHFPVGEIVTTETTIDGKSVARTIRVMEHTPYGIIFRAVAIMHLSYQEGWRYERF